MATWMLATASGLYLLAAFDYLRDGNHGLALAFTAYAIANVGFVLAATHK